MDKDELADLLVEILIIIILGLIFAVALSPFVVMVLFLVKLIM